MEILSTILYIVFGLVSVLLIGIVLLQEGKGGGLGGAFGGAGGEMLGHGAGGINRVTGVLAAVLFILAIALVKIESHAA